MILIVIVMFMISWLPMHLFNIINIQVKGIEKYALKYFKYFIKRYL